MTIFGWYSFFFSQNCRFQLFYSFHLGINLAENCGARVLIEIPSQMFKCVTCGFVNAITCAFFFFQETNFLLLYQALSADKSHFVDLIIEMGWWSEKDIEMVKILLYEEVSFVYIILSYQVASSRNYIEYLKVS